MAGRLLALLAVVVSLVGFIGQEADWSGWWSTSLSHGSYVLVVLAVVAALLAARRPSVLVLWLQVLAATAAIAFEIVALVKYDNEGSTPFGPSLESALLWAGQAQVFGVAALAFGLTLARRRNTIGPAALVAALALAVGTGIYAVTLKTTFSGYLWWSLAGIGAFLAAAAAAGLERGGGVALSAPVTSSAGGGSGSNPGVE